MAVGELVKRVVDHMTSNGAALFEASARTRGIDPMPPVDAEKYPKLAQAVADNPFDDEQLFVESLRSFLAGVRERVERDTIGKPLD